MDFVFFNQILYNIPQKSSIANEFESSMLDVADLRVIFTAVTLTRLKL